MKWPFNFRTGRIFGEPINFVVVKNTGVEKNRYGEFLQ